MKKITVLFLLYLLTFTTAMAAELKQRGFVVDTRRIMEGLPVVGEIIKDAQREDEDKEFHTHESGVYYENVTHDLFMQVNYTVRKGSLKENLERLCKKYGWQMMWELRTDYDVPVGFTIKNKRVPEIFAEAVLHLPIRVTFYTKNKVITIHPMYDKRETDVGTKYSINPRG